jgi:hypothetical protein
MKLEEIGFTRLDFDLLNEALDNLPNKGSTGKMLTQLMVSALVKDESQKLEMEKKDKRSGGKRG